MLRCRDVARGLKDLWVMAHCQNRSDQAPWGDMNERAWVGILYSSISLVEDSDFKVPSLRRAATTQRKRHLKTYIDVVDRLKRLRREPLAPTSMLGLRAAGPELLVGMHPQAYQALAQGPSQDSHQEPTMTGRAAADRSSYKFPRSLEPAE